MFKYLCSKNSSGKNAESTTSHKNDEIARLGQLLLTQHSGSMRKVLQEVSVGSLIRFENDDTFVARDIKHFQDMLRALNFFFGSRDCDQKVRVRETLIVDFRIVFSNL